ncbi:MAG: hypothetical protein ACOVS5_12595 [Oligoflexus sp.]
MVRPKAFSDRSFDVLRVATIELLQGRDNEARRQLFAVARPESEVARLRQVLEKPPPEKDVEQNHQNVTRLAYWSRIHSMPQSQATGAKPSSPQPNSKRLQCNMSYTLVS